MERFAPFSSTQEERWNEISDFPSYHVSDWGRVLNEKTGNYISPTANSRGVAIVGMMRNAVQHRRSLALLVATAFVRPPEWGNFDAPINLDGDRFNNHWTNLIWRPLWFARKYHRQFLDNHATFDNPIEDVETHEQYKNSMHAATTHGLLDTEIYLSMLNNTYVWPTNQIFREIGH